MNGISHKQAIKLIHRRLDGLLTENQISLLDEHLRSCNSCRVYSDEVELVPSRLQNEFHARWDAQRGPSENVAASIRSETRRLFMSSRMNVVLRTVAGVAVLVIMALVLIYVLPGMKTIVNNPPLTRLPTLTNSALLVIDPQSCKPSTLDSVPGDLHSYDIVQNTSFVDGDFSYEFWLYCDPSLKPDDEKHLNAIAGLGIYATWRYNGPQVEGENQYYFEWEPNVPLGTTSWNGPFYKASVTGAKFGVDLSKAAVQASIQQGTPLQFRVVIDSPVGQKGSVLSFNLEPTNNGLNIVDLNASKLDAGDIIQEKPTRIFSYNGLIAFTSQQNGNFDIYTMRADGSEITNITNSPANDYAPIWSRDGKRMFFSSERTGNTDIFSMDSDGSQLAQLTDNSGYDGFFSLSPNGERIIYSSSANNDSNVASLVIMDADGSNKVKLTDAGSFIFLGWSPDGQKIVYLKQTSENPQGDEIHVSNIDGKNHYEWNAIIDEIKWEDEQHFIGYGWGGQSESPTWALYRFSSNGTPPAEIASHSSPIIALYDHTHVVEGGSLLAWYTMDGNPTPLHSWDVKGDCKQRGDQYIQETSQAISPDGQYAFITVYCNDGYLQFYFANADGSEFKQLTDLSVETSINYRGVWSLDGKYVMIPFTNRDGTTTDFYLFDIEAMLRDPSTQPIQLTTDGAAKDDIVWQPNP